MNAQEPTEEVKRLRASLAAIHYNACRADADRAVLLAIRDECERAVPELAKLRGKMRRIRWFFIRTRLYRLLPVAWAARLLLARPTAADIAWARREIESARPAS